MFADNMYPNPAPLSIHLHNTQRKVQLQGGSSMPDKSTAPVWFVDNVLKPMFVKQAQSQGIQIAHINQLVSNIGSRQLDPAPNEAQIHCFHCKKKFSTNSRPVLCPKCSNLKHSTRCSPCPVASTTPCTGMALSSASATQNTEMTSAIPGVPAPGIAYTVTTAVTCPQPEMTRPLNSLTSSPTQLPSTAQQSTHTSDNASLATSPRGASVANIQDHPALASVTSALPSKPLPAIRPSMLLGPPFPLQTVQDTSQVLTLSLQDRSCEQLPPVQTVPLNTGNTRKPAKRTPQIDKSAFETECLKKQLNIAHTKITEVETELKRTKDTNHILSERIKLFEEANNKELFERYFPRDKSNLFDDGKPRSRSPCYPRHHYCCSCAPPPCVHHSTDISQEKDLAVTIAELSSKVSLLAHDISEVRVEIKKHWCGYHIHNTSGNADTVLATAPPPPDITGHEAGRVPPNTSAGHDMSISSDSNTIDDNVPTDLPNHSEESLVPLNYSVLTNQLSQQQLGLTQNI